MATTLQTTLTLSLILIFWLNGLTGLDRFPKIHEDESWQAAPGYTFWAEGHFGTNLFAGFYGMEENYYGFMPLFPILVGAALHLFGIGLFQARLVPLILIILTLALTHRLGRTLFTPWHGILAVAILVTWRIAGPFAHLVSGIPMADVARIVRYDSAVPLFGLAAVVVFVWVVRFSLGSLLNPQNVISTGYEKKSSLFDGASSNKREDFSLRSTPFRSVRNDIIPFFSIGLLIGLATLSHLYGAFWLPALTIALLWLIGWRAIVPGLTMAGGFFLTLTPWFIFVASGWTDFVNQGRNYSDRFGLLDYRFYTINLLQEVERYDPILNGAKQSVGAWLWLIGCGVSLGWLVWRAFGIEGQNTPLPTPLPKGEGLGVRGVSRILIATVATIGLLFALLLSFKTFSYLATLWPLFALIIAAGFLKVWHIPTRWKWWRPALATLFLLGVGEGLVTEWQMKKLGDQITPYQTYTQAIIAKLPPEQRVMGLPHYWLGLAEATADYRAVLVPIFWTSPAYVSDPIPFSQAIDTIPPDILLIDQIMLDFLAEVPDTPHPPGSLEQQINEFLQNNAIRLETVEDETYGRMEIYQLE